MKRFLFAAVAVGAAIVLAGCGGATVASPTHVVNVYLDGLNHMDYRQACATIHAPIAFPTQAACEGYFSYMAAVNGQQRYVVVKGSQKVWTETYRGRELELAVVKYANLTNPYILTAHLRLIHGEWRLWAVTT
jgi:hypothetical protein